MTRWIHAFLLTLGFAAAPLANPAADDLLQRNKQATGGPAWDAVIATRSQFQLETSGLQGTGDSFEDSRNGFYVDHFELGAFKGASGFDGDKVWEQDSSGEVAVQGADNNRQAAINDAYRRSHSYWYKDRARAQIDYAGQRIEGGRSFHLLRMMPAGGRLFEMWLDAKTNLLDRITEQDARDLRTTFFSDYRWVDGKRVAFFSRQTNGQPKYDTIVKTMSVRFESTSPRTAFAPPPPPKRDFGLVRGTAAAMPFSLVNNHIYLDIKLNGRPFTVLFDSGGLNVITPTIARQLGLNVEGNVQVSGSGEKRQEAGFTIVKRLDVGDAWLENQTFVVIGLESFQKVEGKAITGIVGYEVFKRFIVSMDYERSHLVLSDPAKFSYHGAGTRVEMVLNDRTPEIAGVIDGVPGKFTLDTGARSGLELASPFVAKNNLVAKYGAKFQGVTGWGVGGPTRSWIVRAQHFALGGETIDAPVIELSQAKAGSSNDAYLAGNIGAAILKRFNIVWDYPHLQLFLERNKNYAERDVYDRAGFWVNEGVNAFDVIDVTAGAPANLAGLKTGDRILTVNGKKALSEISLPDSRLLKKAPPGTNLILEIQRGTERRTINILLKDWI